MQQIRYLDKLIDEGLFFKSIKDSIGEGIKLDNGYYSYNDDINILIKLKLILLD